MLHARNRAVRDSLVKFEKKHTATTRLQLGLVLQRKSPGAMNLTELNAYYVLNALHMLHLPLTSILRGNKRLRKINSLAQDHKANEQ